MRHAIIAVAALGFFLTGTAAHAQRNAPPAPTAPVPQQILAAKKIFIANGAGDSPAYLGNEDPTYDEFYAGVKTANRYTLVSSVGEADVVVQVSGAGYECAQGIFVRCGGYVRVLFLDPKSGIRIWGIAEGVEAANLSSTAKKNYETAVQKLVQDMNALMGGAVTPSN